MIVMKFGGTSVADGAAMRRVIDIVLRHADLKPLVVCSACAGVTNILIEVADAAMRADETTVVQLTDSLRARHQEAAAELLLEADESLRRETAAQIEELSAELKRLAEGVVLLRECTPRSRAAILSFGERLSTLIVAAGFRAAGRDSQLLDARELMLTDSVYLSAAADMTETRKRCKKTIQPLLERACLVVTQGFIGADAKNVTTTNGRGGGDLSAAIFGAALGVDEIQIWTDVSGVYTTDPRLAPNARTIARITFDEVGELAYFGARVLHPDTIRPAVADAIPVRVRNTFDAEHEGTLLVPNALPDVDGIRAVAIRKRMILLSFAMRSANRTSRFLAGVYNALVNLGIEALAAQGSEHHYVLCLEDPDAAANLAREFREFAEVDISEAAVLCAVGPRVAGADGAAVVARLAQVLQPFEALFVQHHVGNISILAAVPAENGDEALRAAHDLIS